MLRIEKVGEDEATATLRLEGKIVGQWVTTLEEECVRVLRGRKRLVLDFAGVTFIDGQGAATLARLGSERVQCVSCSPFVKELLGYHRKS